MFRVSCRDVSPSVRARMMTYLRPLFHNHLYILIVWIFGLCLGFPVSAHGAVEDSEDRILEKNLYYDALAEARRGEIEAAKDSLRELMRRFPEGSFVDDAAFEICRITDQTEQRYLQAVPLYEKFLKQFARSRLSRKARYRLKELQVALKTGEKPFKIFESILESGFDKENLPPRILQMQQLLKDYPDFSLKDRAMKWIAGAHARLGDLDEAIASLETMRDVYGLDSRQGREARLKEAELWMELGQVANARNHFKALASTEGYGKDVALKRLDDIEESTLRKVLYWIGWGFLVVVAALAFFVFRRQGANLLRAGWPPPLDLLFVLPFVAGAGIYVSGKSIFIWTTVLGFGLSSVVLVWINAAVWKAGFKSMKQVFVYLPLYILVCFFVLYIVGTHAEIIDQLIYDAEFVLPDMWDMLFR